MMGMMNLLVDKTPMVVLGSESLDIGEFGCPHSDRDWTGGTRRPLQKAITSAWIAGFALDSINVLGDWTGLQAITQPEIDDAVERIQNDLNAALSSHGATTSKPFDLKSITGNHIAQANSFALYQEAVDDWLAANVDQSNEVRDPNSDYNFESYHYTKGNCLFFFMGDRNDISAPWGKDGSSDSGGHPAGAIKFTTLKRFIHIALTHLDYNIFSHSHQGLPDTVVGSAVGNGYFGHNPLPLAVQDYRGNVGGLYDPDLFSGTDDVDENPDIWAKIFEDFDLLSILHCSCHTHAPIGYKDAGGGVHGKLGQTHCTNIGTLTQHHGEELIDYQTPSGSILHFSNGVKSAYLLRLITEDRTAYEPAVAMNDGDIYTSFNRSIELKVAYSPTYVNKGIIAPSAVTSLAWAGGELTWSGSADGFMVLSAASSPTFVFTDGIAAHVPTYEIKTGEVLQSITDKNALTVATQPSFMVVPFNAGGGFIVYGAATTI